MVTESFPPIRPPRGRWLIIAGVIITAVALIVGVTSGVLVVRSVGGPLAESLTSPSRPTPVDEQLTFKAGRYTVFELTGRQSSSGPITTTNNSWTTVTPDMVEVTGPGGDTITASALTTSSETLTRNQSIYTGAARFVVPEPGVYHVHVDSPTSTQVVIAPSFGSGLRAVLGWLVAGIASFAAFVVGVVLVIVGAVRRRRPAGRPAQVTQAPHEYTGVTDPPVQDAGPPRGWYPAPDMAGRQRYWDGHAWTDQLR
jgi:hypothetical protein